MPLSPSKTGIRPPGVTSALGTARERSTGEQVVTDTAAADAGSLAKSKDLVVNYQFLKGILASRQPKQSVDNDRAILLNAVPLTSSKNSGYGHSVSFCTESTDC